MPSLRLSFRLLALAVLGLANASASASAAPAPGSPSSSPSPATSSGQVPEVHDGFYLRLSGGPGWLQLDRRTEHAGAAPTLAYLGDSSAVSGWSPSAEMSVGGTPAERLVVAGTLLAPA